MKRNSVARALWLSSIIVTLLVGCRDDRDPRLVAESEVVDAFIDELCGPMFSCTCEGQTRYASREECRGQAAQGFARLREAAAGLTYDPTCYGELLEAIGELACKPGSATDDACVPTCAPYHGSRAEWASCEVLYGGISNCAQGLSCFGGVCQDRCRSSDSGEPCGMQGCAEGLWCNYAESPPTCRMAAGQGESCAERACDEGLWCNDGTCRQLPADGEACSPFGCREGTFCDTSDPNAPTCRRLGNAGDPCRGHSQCSTGYCPSGFCAPIPGEGDSCAGTFICSEGLSCREDVCVPARPAVCQMSLPWPPV
jgi:hypothetical protein